MGKCRGKGEVRSMDGRIAVLEKPAPRKFISEDIRRERKEYDGDMRQGEEEVI